EYMFRGQSINCMASHVGLDQKEKIPICKIMDFHREKQEKYEKQVQEKDRTKNKSEVTLRQGDCKEVRFTGKIELKDLQMKASMVKRLMEKGYRVKCTSTDKEDEDFGGNLSRLTALLEDTAVVESGPLVEKKQAYVIIDEDSGSKSNEESDFKIPSLIKSIDGKLERKSGWSSIDKRSGDFCRSRISEAGKTKGCIDGQTDGGVPVRKPPFEVENRYARRNEPRSGIPPPSLSTQSILNDPNQFATVPKSSPSVQYKPDINRFPPGSMDSRRSARPLLPPSPPLVERRENGASTFRTLKQPILQ
ncbi:hypothetical protein MKW92_028955, partial [Papaver armeniacum]